jgi:hypothetical protein
VAPAAEASVIDARRAQRIRDDVSRAANGMRHSFLLFERVFPLKRIRS